MKILCTVFLFGLLLAVDGFSQAKKEESNTAPKAATIKITLLDLPGGNLEKSKWEVAYELRIFNEKEFYEAVKSGKLKQMDTEEKLGVLIGKGNFTKNALSKNENREVVLTVPLDEEIQAKLKNQPQNRINLSKVTVTDEIIKKSKEDETKAQVFLMYANALVYDAKLKKTTIIPLSWILPFRRHPDANFEMTLRVEENGGYSNRLVLPSNQKSTTVTIKQ